MRKTYLKFSEPTISDEEINEVAQTLKSGWLTTGEKAKTFEEKFAHYIGTKHAVSVSSGTAALFLSLLVNDIVPGDEVITTPFTFISTANIIIHLGANPVFVDIEDDTYNINPLKAQRAVTQKTKAIIPVHYSGQPCDMKSLMQTAKVHKLHVIEDAAHALGAEYYGKKVGSLGNLTCFSFFPTKNITSGEGGMIVLDDTKKAERLLRLRLHGMSKDGWKRYAKEGSWYYEVHEPGYKFNLSDINAALGMIQLNKINQLNRKRELLVKLYLRAFSEIPGIKTLTVRPEMKNSWHIFPIWVDKKILGIDRNALIKELWKRNIGTSVHFIPIHLQPFYQKKFHYKRGDFPVAEKIYEGIISLPLFPNMEEKDVNDVIEAIKNAIS